METGRLLEASAGFEVMVDAFLDELRVRVGDVTGFGDADEVAAALVAVERVLRGAEAAATDLVGDADLRALFTFDGHRSVNGWVAATIRVSYAETIRRVRRARLFRRFPQVADLARTGHIGTAQTGELARVAANPRCGDQLDAAIDVLVDAAMHDDFETFRTTLRDWERLADADGAHRQADEAHDGRHASVVGVGDSVVVHGEFGVVQGDVIGEIFDAFTDAEFAADWADAVERYGDLTCEGLLARNPRQRRADALYAIFSAAAAHDGPAAPVDATVNIVVDHATFDQALNDLADAADPFRPRDRDRVRDDPPAFDDTGRARFCRTLTGLPVDPADAVAAALIGHVRRVVIGADGVIIDLGRRRRLFTGSARDAAIIQATLDRLGRCIWPGCRLSYIQIDHTTAWRDDGCTNVANSAPLCGHHNRFKTRGYTTHRDEHGRWHTHRPDGTEINPN